MIMDEKFKNDLKKAFNEYEVNGIYDKSHSRISLISGDLLCEWDLSPDKLIKIRHGHKVTHLLNEVYVISKLNQIFQCPTGQYVFEFQEAFLYFFALKMLNIKLDLEHNNMYINHFKDDINPLDENPNVKLTIK
jgi:hypothetical protein